MSTIRKTHLPGHNNNRHLTNDELDNNIGQLAVTDSKLRELFEAFDANHNGFLDFSEVKKLVKAQEWYGLEPSDAQIDSMIRKYSKSADNHVTFEEFSCLWLAMAQL
jgi:Ca2+-binding EF-hand superfamily protein